MSGAEYLATRSAGPACRTLMHLTTAGSPGEAAVLSAAHQAVGPRPSHHPPSRSAKMPPHASFVGAALSITLALNSLRVEAFPRVISERVARLSYRSVRGSPNWGKTLLSANQVIADIRSPSSVRTNSPRGRAMSVLGMGR
jgi:hypothetical protein